MLPLFLIVILSLFVFYSIRVMIKHGHDLHAISFLFLYIYTVFAQIGYVYYSDLSKLIGAYFGLMLFYNYWFFMFFSFFFAFLLYKKINFKNDKKYVYVVKPKSTNNGQFLFFLIAIIIYLTLNLYFNLNRELFAYGGGKSMGGPWFGIGFLLFQICTFILYTIFRDISNKVRIRIFSFIFFIISLYFFLKITVASGSRSHILYFFIGLSVYELYPLHNSIKFKKKKIFLFLAACFIVFILLSIIRTIRDQGTLNNLASIYNFEGGFLKKTDEGMTSEILFQDYYLPSHTLFVSMYYEIIDPIEVIVSNLANSLVYFEYPFLTTTILDRGLGLKNDRGVGWAYHYFVEGYNALGLFGVLYNALFWNLGMSLWIRLTRLNNRMLHKSMIAIIALIVVFSAKGQTATFIKYYWLFLLPGLALLLLANNSKIIFYRSKR